MAARHFPFPRYRISVVLAGLALNAAAFGATPAPASLVGEVEGTVRSVVPPVTVPTAPPPDPAPAPSTSPSPPAAAPAAPQVPVELPAKVAGSVAGGDTAEAAKEATSPAREDSRAVAGGSDAIAPPDEGGARAAPSGSGAAGGGDAASGARTVAPKRAAREAPPAIRPAKAAAPWRWLARVWPAIELGRDGPAPALLAKLEDGRPLALSDAAQLLVLGIDQSSGESAKPALAAHPIAADPPPTAPYGGLAPDDRGFALFVIFYFAAVLAALASTVWTKLRTRYR
jgi:hypothetical protein